MPTDVVMPQMGESIAEGTIVRWLKKVGDPVDRDDPLFEISTDKVDAEIPSPAGGVVTEIRVQEGETVPVNSVVAVIGAAGEAASAGGRQAAAPSAPAAAPSTPPSPAAKPPEPPKPSPQADGTPSPVSGSTATSTGRSEDRPLQKEDAQAQPRVESRPSQPPSATPSPVGTGLQTGPQAADAQSPAEAVRQRSSPLVRKIAREHHVDIAQLHGTGIAGRVTKADILEYIEQAGPGGQVGQEGQVGQGQAGQAEHAPPRPSPAATGAAAATAHSGPKPSDRVEKMTVMRKRIAEHMMASRRTSAHVHSVFEVNFSRVAKIRESRKAEFERAGAKLTFMSFIIKAAADALREVPVVNASVDGDTIVYHGDVNIGVAVALDWGLIVPVIKKADERNLLGLSRAVVDLANRARTKQLKPDEVQGGTFTITNPGVFGALFGMPIINQPQVAILGVGNVEKRAVVIDDAIAIRSMAYLTLGYDHRIIDGAVADQFMSAIKRALENWDPAAI